MAAQSITDYTTKANQQVDQQCSIAQQVHIFNEDGNYYSLILSCVNIAQNNNKFFIIQLLESDENPDNFYFFSRWGRVGVLGQNALIGPISLECAKQKYLKKFNDKTKLGTYQVIQLDLDPQEPINLKKKNEPICKLDEKLQDLLFYLFDTQYMNFVVQTFGYDVKKLPVDRLRQEHLEKGFNTLCQILEVLNEQEDQNSLTQLSNQFYTLIPHNFGFQPLSAFLLNNQNKVQEKFNMLISLSHVMNALKILEQPYNDELHKLEAQYSFQNSSITPLDESHEDYKMVEDYINNTKGVYSIQEFDIYQVKNKELTKKYDPSCGNKYLLWQHSPFEHVVSILSEGLKIFPIEGQAFGKGLYFFDMFEKCIKETSKQSDAAIALLFEVAMGNIEEKKEFDNQQHLNLPEDKHSVQGLSCHAPLMKTSLNSGVKYASEKPKNTYNQYVIYNENQAILRFIVKYSKKDQVITQQFKYPFKNK